MHKFFKKDGKWFAEVKCPDCGRLHDISHKNYYHHTFRCAKCGRLHGATTRRNPNLKKIMKSGYVKLYRPENSMADKRGEVYEHRLIISEILGRPLHRKEHVHHIDGKKANNKPTNLKIFSEHDHQSLHTKTRIARGEIILTHWGIKKTSSKT
jgi:phage FluMu protein Com